MEMSIKNISRTMELTISACMCMWTVEGGRWRIYGVYAHDLH